MRKNDKWRKIDNGAVLNAYPDSMGGTLGDIVTLLQKSEFENAFHSFYILPSLFHSDLDRGFSVIDYQLNTLLATEKDLEDLRKCGISLKLDFVLNHLSVQSPQFQNLLLNGEASPYKDFFIEWNKFWNNYGVMTDEGYIQPYPSLIENMFFRKPGLPILMVHMPNGENVPYWNTFYQKVSCDSNKKQYLGQMDLNIKSPLVWDFYKNTLQTLAGYGADIVRLDAFAYAPKEPGKHNFLNIPDTWDLLERVREIADGYEVNLLPEIHASYAEKIYLQLAQKGYMTYDFFLPGLILDAFERKQGALLISWAQEQRKNGIHVINMLGCHDGIPLLDLKGLVPDAQIEKLIDTVVKRGGYVKNLHGQKNIYYQVNATYYSALGENDRKMLLARAIQLFMPGKPQVWYLDLFAGTNDYKAVEKFGEGGHKEINRTNLTIRQITDALKKDVVQKQLHLLRWRNTFPAFGFETEMLAEQPTNETIRIMWKQNKYTAVLEANLATEAFSVYGKKHNKVVFFMEES